VHQKDLQEKKNTDREKKVIAEKVEIEINSEGSRKLTRVLQEGCGKGGRKRQRRPRIWFLWGWKMVEDKGRNQKKSDLAERKNKNSKG